MWSYVFRHAFVCICLLLSYFYSWTLLPLLFSAYLIGILGCRWFQEMYTVCLLMPPGPTPLPYFGNLVDIWLRREEQGVLAEMSDHYGPIFTLFLPKPVVVVCEPMKFNRLVRCDRPKSANRLNSPHLIRKPFALSSHERKHNIQLDKWTCQNPVFVRFIGDGRGFQTERLQKHADALVEQLNNELKKTDLLLKHQKVEMDISKLLKTTAISMIVELVLGRDIRFDNWSFINCLKHCCFPKDEELLVELATEKTGFTDWFKHERPAAENFFRNRQLLENEIKNNVETVRLDVKNSNPPISFIEKYATLNFEPLRRHHGQRYRFAELQSDTLVAICADVLEQTIRPVCAVIDNSIAWIQANEHVQERMHEEYISKHPNTDYYEREGFNRLVHEFLRQFCEQEWHNIMMVGHSELRFDEYTLPAGTTVINFCPMVETKKTLVENNFALPKHRCMCDAITHRVLVHLYTNLFEHFILLPAEGTSNPDSKTPLCTIKRRPKKIQQVRARHHDDPTPWETDAFQIGDKVRISRQPTVIGFSSEMPHKEITASDNSIEENGQTHSLQRTKSSVSALLSFMKRNNQLETTEESEMKPSKRSFLKTFLAKPNTPNFKESQTSITEENPDEDIQVISRGRSATVSSRIKGMFATKRRDKPENKHGSVRRRRKRRPSLPLPDVIHEDDSKADLPPVLRDEYTA